MLSIRVQKVPGLQNNSHKAGVCIDFKVATVRRAMVRLATAHKAATDCLVKTDISFTNVTGVH